MRIFNYAVNSLFDFFFYPFVGLDPIYGLSAISLLTAVIVLPIFKYTSDQEGIKNIKAIIMGHILELRLFRDNMRLVLSAQKNVLRHNLTYLKYTLKPLLFMLIPVVIIILQTEVRYSFRSLHPGETALIKIKMSEPNNEDVSLSVPEGLSLETPPVRVEEEREIYWRIKAEKEGAYDLTFKVQEENEIKKTVFVSDEIVRLSPETLKGNALNIFLNPADFYLSDSSIIDSVSVRYPPMKVSFFGWNSHWLVLYFILTLIFSFLLLKPFKVRI
jgi:uncharacterized membrane protein (DUF106 family)